jgi:GT2 family glycosyltransferase
VLATLDRLTALPERPPVVLVDNGSTDGTVEAVRRRHPRVTVLPLPENRGAVARTVGVQHARTPLVAFADDDSWWAPGSLARAAEVLQRTPQLGGVVGRVVLEPQGTLDRVSAKHLADLLGTPPGFPGPWVLSAPAFALVLRREAFLAVGGFSPLLFFGGEEGLLVPDLTAAGSPLALLPGAVAHHAHGDRVLDPRRWALQTRNDVLVLWMRRPLSLAVAATTDLVRRALRDPAARSALAGLLRRWPVALRSRRPLPAELEAAMVVAQTPWDGRSAVPDVALPDLAAPA